MQPYTYSSLPFAPAAPVGAPAPPPPAPPPPAPGPARPEIDGQVLGPDGFLLPHHRSFQAVYNLFSKTYSYRWDEAVRHGLENAQAMRRDTYFRALMAERLDPLGHWDWDVRADPDPLNPKDPYAADKAKVARMLRAEAAACPDLMKFRRHLGWSAWFGRVANQVLYEPNPAAGLAWNPKVPVAWEPVDGDKLQWSWGDGGADRRGHWCVLINPTSRGEYPPDETAVTDRSTVLRLRRADYRRRFVVGTHEIEDAPYEDVTGAGRARGVGLRDFVYWGWWLRDEMLSWMVSLAEKAGTLGILLFKYPRGNEAAKLQAEKNAKEVSNRNALTVPVEPGTHSDDYGVEVVALPTNGLQFLKEVTFDYFDKHFERLFIGQSGSSSSEGHGLGGTGIAKLHEDTKFARLKFDAENQGEYLSADYVGVLKELNHRDAPGVYRWKYQLPDPKAKEKLEAITKAATIPGARLSYKADEVRELVGMSKPDPGDEVVGGADPAPAGPPGMPGMPSQPGSTQPGSTQPGAPPGSPPAPGAGARTSPPPAPPPAASPAGPPAAPPQPAAGPPTDEEAADAIAGLIGAMNRAIGVDAPGNRDAALAAVRAKRGDTAPVAYRAAEPPWPGAVFDEAAHRWKVGGEGGGSTAPRPQPQSPPAAPQPGRPQSAPPATAPPAGGFDAAAVVGSLGREHAAELTDPQARAAAGTVATRLYEAVAGVLFRLSPGVRAVAEAVLDTPEDMQRLGYNPTGLGTHHETADPVKAATGVSAHLAMTLASHVLAAAFVKGKRVAGYDAGGALLPYAADAPAKFASTQIDLTGDAAGRLLALGAAIPEGELADDGRETEPHVTVKYGLHTADPADVHAAVEDFGPVTLTLTRLAAFRAADTGKGYDVLVCEVDSPDLHRLNAAVAAGCAHTDTWPTYKPHATVAYLQPGAADKYVRETPPLALAVTADRIEFSDTARRRTTVFLTGRQAFPSRPPVLYAAAHAPAGGVTVGGTEYTGGQFIPAEVMAAATKEERTAVEGGGGSRPASGQAADEDEEDAGDEHADTHAEWEAEDETAEDEREAANDAADEVAQAEVDAHDEAFEAATEAHEAKREKEDAAVEKARAKEDKEHARAEAELERGYQKRRDERAKEDAGATRERAKMDARHDAEQKALAKDHTTHDAATAKARAAEDKDRRAGQKQEDADLAAKHEAEDAAAPADEDEDTSSERYDRQQEEIAEQDERHEAADEAVNQARDEQDEQDQAAGEKEQAELDGPQNAEIDAMDDADAARETAREAEDAEYEAAYERLADAEIERDHARAAEDEQRQDARDAEDAERQERHDRAAAEREAARDAADEARVARWDAEDAESYRAREKANPAAHKAYRDAEYHKIGARTAPA